MQRLSKKHSRGSGRHGFTLVELLVTSSITVLLLLALAGVLGASLEAMGQATRSVQHQDASTQLLQSLRDDLMDLSVLGEAGVPALLLMQDEEGTTLGVVRPDPRFYDFSRQGYYRHVEYAWRKEDRSLTRSVWHAADGLLAGELGSDANSANHEANALRLTRLTPVLRPGAGWNWLESPEMAQARAASRGTAHFQDLDVFEVECLDAVQSHAVREWRAADRLPMAVRVRLAARSSRRQGEPRTFEFLVPVQTRVLVRR